MAKVTENAIKDANIIEAELKQYPNSVFRKSYLKLRYGLPLSESTLVFEVLRQRGFIVKQFKVIVPKV